MGAQAHVAQLVSETLGLRRYRSLTLIAPTARVSERAVVAESARVWDLAQIREDARVGRHCVVGMGAYIDAGVVVGDNCKIQNYALIYSPAVLDDGVFVGPAAVFTNDVFPRAVNRDGSPRGEQDWDRSGVTVRRGASIGGGAVVLGGVQIGSWSLVGAASVVTSSVEAHALVVGNPARSVGWVGVTGRRLEKRRDRWVDPSNGDMYEETDGRLAAL